MIGKTISHFKILKKLGEGGMGVVYKAEDTKLDRHVALKFLPSHLTDNEEEKQRFIHEAKSASALEHPNITTIYEIDDVEGQTFIAMECVEGETLKDKVERGPLKTKELLNIAIGVADGLNAAHEHDIVHRDIKSENIMISKTAPVKIMDFGLAKRKGVTRVTKEGTTLGTLAYMSPEQAEGLEVDRRSDLFSFGVVMYEMATGQLPFKGEHDAAILYAIVNEEPLPVTTLNPNIHGEIERIIHKALEKEPEDRYQHADDLSADLKKLKKDIETRRTKTITTQPPVTREPKKKPIWRQPAYVLGILIVVVIGVIFYSTVLKDSSIPVEYQVNPKSVAVLPFTSISRTEEDEIFSDGIHDDILTQLAKIRDIRVIARTSVMKYRNTDKRISEIGRELGVASILEGSVRRAGGRIRIVSQLVDVKTDEHLWAETYDRDYVDIFAIQSDVAQNIAMALEATLTPEEKGYIEQKPTENMEAYDYFLRGNYYWNTKTTKEGNLKAVEMYERAIELDPEFALAYARESIVHCALYDALSWDHTPERLEKARTTLEKAISLNPDHPEVHFAQGFYYDICLEDYDRALKEYEIAFRGQPNNSEIAYHLGALHRRMGMLEKAEYYALRSYELDPKGIYTAEFAANIQRIKRNWVEAERYINLAITAFPEQHSGYCRKADIYVAGYGDLEGAREVIEDGIRNVGEQYCIYHKAWIEVLSRDYEKALEIYMADTEFFDRYLYIGMTYLLLEQKSNAQTYLDSARVEYEDLIQEEPDNDYYHRMLGNIYAGLGYKDKAIKEGLRAVELVPLAKDAVGGASNIWGLMFTYLLAGEYDSALDQLERLFSIPYPISAWSLKLNPWYDPLRNHPRFQRLVAEG